MISSSSFTTSGLRTHQSVAICVNVPTTYSYPIGNSAGLKKGLSATADTLGKFWLKQGCLFVYNYTQTCTHTHRHTHIHMHRYTYVCIHIDIHVYKCTHTRTHTQSHRHTGNIVMETRGCLFVYVNKDPDTGQAGPHLSVLSICMVRRYDQPTLARMWWNFLACSTYGVFQMPQTPPVRVATGEISQLPCGIE